MAGRDVDLKSAEDVKEYIDNLGTEYRFGCYHEKSPKSCHLLADYMEAVKKDFSKSLKIYTTNCDEYHHGHSCHKVAGYKLVGKACSEDVDGAFDYFRKGCENGFSQSCLNAGILDNANPDSPGYKRTVPPNPSAAKVFFKKACEGDIAEGCHRYASLFITGIAGVLQKNMEEAFGYALKGCELGNIASCVNVSIMYKKGDGVSKDDKASKHYADLASDMMKQMHEERERIKFQEGAETV